ncbi:glycoside hydrolase family 114 protein [Aulographum hederae CBS 113979]|uniref:alpha-galactosidase n=1 Tax=Aulographum hederae CBS 113979 TaxID=1176131 RepID=A0A6G1GSM8_9PEZI|nr:glycoside hydrolase family 114 protein [Aulographum hederae CBS 113979]
MQFRTNLLSITALLPLLPLTTAWWKPPANLSWQIVLNGSLVPFANMTVIDGDLFDTPANVWSDLRKAGHIPLCYFSAGSAENWRDDYKDFAAEDMGSTLEHWEDEKWLNVKSKKVRKIMQKRMDLAVEKGCVAIDPDNVDVYDNGGGGFSLTAPDSIEYVKWLVSEGHKRGLSVGLKNAASIVGDVLADVDFQVNEECGQIGECDLFRSFIEANKPVFGIEYVEGEPSRDTVDAICGNVESRGFSTVIKHLDLKEWVVYCNGTIPFKPKEGARSGASKQLRTGGLLNRYDSVRRAL